MKWSQTLIPTMKEIPNGAEIPSHIFMLRAGMISQVMAGAYADIVPPRRIICGRNILTILTTPVPSISSY